MFSVGPRCLTACGRGRMRGRPTDDFPTARMSRGSGNPGESRRIPSELVALNTWLERVAAGGATTRPLPAPSLPPARPTPEADAERLVALLAEGATPMLLNGRLFLLGRVTRRRKRFSTSTAPRLPVCSPHLPRARQTARSLAAKLAEVDAWRWPGTADAAGTLARPRGILAGRRARAMHLSASAGTGAIAYAMGGSPHPSA